MSDAALEWNYTHGATNVSNISPDSWVLQSALLNRPGNKEIMLDLLYDYRTNSTGTANGTTTFAVVSHQP